jgi:hypothetical protein
MSGSSKNDKMSGVCAITLPGIFAVGTVISDGNATGMWQMHSHSADSPSVAQSASPQIADDVTIVIAQNAMRMILNHITR